VNKRAVEIMVGIFMLAGALGLVFLAMKAANLGTFTRQANTYPLEARFENIGGLKVRAPVRSAGVVVGRVTSIKLDGKTYQGVVSMDIQDGVKFPKDSSAQILTSGLLGDQYIGMLPGGDLEDLQPDDVITRTQSAVVLENLIGQFIFNKSAESGTPEGSDAPAAGGSAP